MTHRWHGRCWPGAAAGSWTNASATGVYDWVLPSHCPALRRYLHADRNACNKRQPSVIAGAPPTNLRSCSVRDEALLAADVGDASILMLGDSTSAQVLHHGCESLGSKPRPFIPIERNLPRATVNKYSHRLRSLDNHACTLPGGGSLSSFSHYGVTGPPFWAYAYPLAPWLANNTFEQVRRDMPHIRTFTSPRGSDPELIIAGSGYWDVAAWWQWESNFSRSYRGAASPMHAESYAAGVTRLVRELRETFANSTVVWRLMHPGRRHSITPGVVHTLNSRVRELAPALHLPLLDTEAIAKGLSRTLTPSLGHADPYGTSDGRHLHEWVNLALLNVIFNLALDVKTHALRRGGTAAHARSRRDDDVLRGRHGRNRSSSVPPQPPGSHPASAPQALGSNPLALLRGKLSRDERIQLQQKVVEKAQADAARLQKAKAARDSLRREIMSRNRTLSKGPQVVTRSCWYWWCDEPLYSR